MSTCQYCQANNPEDAVFCGECGRQLGDPLPPEPPQPPPPPPGPQQSSAPPQPPPAPEGPSQQAAPSSTAYQQRANSSGTGPQAILPDEANGWTFAGCVPFGLYAFAHNLPGWAAMSCIGTVIWPLHWVYFFVIGASGRQMAWKHRQFNNLEEYSGTMKTWNMVGLICLILSVCYWIFAGFMSALDSSAGVYNIYNQIQ